MEKYNGSTNPSTFFYSFETKANIYHLKGWEKRARLELCLEGNARDEFNKYKLGKQKYERAKKHLIKAFRVN